MEEKKYIKISLSTVLLIISIIIIVIMGYFIYNISNEKNNVNNIISNLNNEITNLNAIVNNSQGQIDNAEETTNTNNSQEVSNSDYLTNFSKSVSKELGNANKIYVEDVLNGQLGIKNVVINSNLEAYIRFEESSELYKKYGDEYKVLDDVANAYIYCIGQDVNEYIFLLKKDGTVSYIYLDDSNKSNITINALNNVKDITDIIPIVGDGNKGIGGCSVLFITSDGNCLPYFSFEGSNQNNVNNEIIGNWQPYSAKENNKEISLRNIYGSSISYGGYLTFNSDGTYSNFVGAYSSEVENDLTGNYTISNNTITLNSKSGKQTTLKCEKNNNKLCILEEKSDSIIVYFSKVQ